MAPARMVLLVMSAVMAISSVWALSDRSAGPKMPVKRGRMEGARRDKVIVGTDSRRDVYEWEQEGLSAAVLDRAKRSIAAMIPTSTVNARGTTVRPDGTTVYNFVDPGSYTTLQQNRNLCAGQRFADQPVKGGCSGTLVGNRHVITAGHCIGTASACSSNSFVFNYYLTGSGNNGPVFPDITTDDVYACASYESVDTYSLDWAYITLDRDVNPTRQSPISYTTQASALPLGTPLIMMGFPSGLPLKIDDGGAVQDARASSLDYFHASLDAFGGNSGSFVGTITPDGNDLVQVGILVRGATDYVSGAGTQCNVVNVIPEGTGSESCTYVHNVAPPNPPVNECVTNNGGCAQVCTDTVSGFACACNTNFALAADGTSCEPTMNECATNNGGCAQLCIDAPIGYECGCSPDFSLADDGTSCDQCMPETIRLVTRTWASEISWSILGQHGAATTCASSQDFTDNGVFSTQCCLPSGTYTILCIDSYGDGWHGGRIEVGGAQLCGDSDSWFNQTATVTWGLNECATNNGGCAQVCTDTVSGYTCACNVDFTLAADGTSCEPTMNECATNNGGCAQVCTNTLLGHECGCNPDFSLAHDGTSCDQCNTATVRLVTRTWASETSWSVLDQNGTDTACASSGQAYTNEGVFSTQCCLPSGTYTILCIDSYGDGWHGGWIEAGGAQFCGDSNDWFDQTVTVSWGLPGASPSPSPAVLSPSHSPAPPGQFQHRDFLYHNHVRLTAALDEIVAACPHLVSYTTLYTQQNPAPSSGLDQFVVTVTSSVNPAKSKPGVLSVHNMHGDETVGREVALHLVYKLCTEYDSVSAVTTLVDTTRIYIVPNANPDGFEAGTRGNANNADLNRDYPDRWYNQTDSGTNRERETAALMAFIQSADLNSAHNSHGGAVVCNYPYDGGDSTIVSGTPHLSPDQELYLLMCGTFVGAHATMLSASPFPNGMTNGNEWYQISGGLQDYTYMYQGLPHVTLELSATKYVAESTLQTEWNNNEQAFVQLIQLVHQGVKGTCGFLRINTCDSDGTVINFEPVVSFLLGDKSFPANMVRNDPDHSFHRMLPVGTYTVTVSGGGPQCSYNPTTVTVPDYSITGTTPVLSLAIVCQCQPSPSPLPSPSPSPSPSTQQPMITPTASRSATPTISLTSPDEPPCQSSIRATILQQAGLATNYASTPGTNICLDIGGQTASLTTPTWLAKSTKPPSAHNNHDHYYGPPESAPLRRPAAVDRGSDTAVPASAALDAISHAGWSLGFASTIEQELEQMYKRRTQELEQEYQRRTLELERRALERESACRTRVQQLELAFTQRAHQLKQPRPH